MAIPCVIDASYARIRTVGAAEIQSDGLSVGKQKGAHSAKGAEKAKTGRYDNGRIGRLPENEEDQNKSRTNILHPRYELSQAVVS